MINIAYHFLDRNPEENIPKLLKWVDRLDFQGEFKSQRKIAHQILDNKNGNWFKLVCSFWTDIDDGVRKTFFNNYMINVRLYGYEKQKVMKAKYGCGIPGAILIDPTSACNLHCDGCWAADYKKQSSLDFDTLNSVIVQAKEMGTYTFIFSGGEPLMRKEDILKLCEIHNDCSFLAFTNGTLVDDAFADEMLRVKNLLLAISVEGFEKETDDRRGQGTYTRVLEAMKRLKERKLLFGISNCYTSKNVSVIGSEAYFDQMLEWGAKFAWFFTYIPIGMNYLPELMVSPEQRKWMYWQVHNFRKNKPMFTIDFWNDGKPVNGCLAGGRRYLHINSNGDVEACAFVHYADSNIKEKTLLEAYTAPFFTAYQKNQPFNANHLRPCPLLDNPEKLRQVVKESGAHSTDMTHPIDVDDLTSRTQKAADSWKEPADELWKIVK